MFTSIHVLSTWCVPRWQLSWRWRGRGGELPSVGTRSNRVVSVFKTLLPLQSISIISPNFKVLRPRIIKCKSKIFPLSFTLKPIWMSKLLYIFINVIGIVGSFWNQKYFKLACLYSIHFHTVWTVLGCFIFCCNPCCSYNLSLEPFFWCSRRRPYTVAQADSTLRAALLLKSSRGVCRACAYAWRRNRQCFSH